MATIPDAHFRVLYGVLRRLWQVRSGQSETLTLGREGQLVHSGERCFSGAM